MKVYKKPIQIVLLVLGFLFVSKPKTLAADYGGLGIFPAHPDPEIAYSSSWFIYNLIPGEVKQDEVLIVNTGDEVISAKLYSVDATTTKDGAFALREEHEPRVGVGAWVDLGQSEVTVQPGEELTVPFSIKIPADAQVGDHLGGLVLENLQAHQAKESGINVVTRVGVRIYQTVPGELVKKLKISEFSYRLKGNEVVFSLGLVNEGNVHLAPKASIEILDGFLGKKLTSFEVDLRTVLAGRPTLVPFKWDNSFPGGKFIARARINFGDQPGETIQRELALSYITRLGMVILGLITASLAALVAAVNLRR